MLTKGLRDAALSVLITSGFLFFAIMGMAMSGGTDGKSGPLYGVDLSILKGIIVVLLVSGSLSMVALIVNALAKRLRKA